MNKKVIKQIGIDLIIAGLIVAGISLTVKPVVVRGNSMNDTLQNGNYLMVNKLAYVKSSPERGDIVVFESGIEGEKYLIKRVVAVSGDTIETDGKATKVNGETIEESYINSETKGSGEIKTTKVSDGCVFVMGDNRDNSLDSRDIGEINTDDIIGKVAIRLFPFNELGGIQ